MKITEENILRTYWVYQNGSEWIEESDGNLGACKAIEFMVSLVKYRAICESTPFVQRTSQYGFNIIYQCCFPNDKWRVILPSDLELEYCPKIYTQVNSNRYLNTVTGEKLFPGGVYGIENGDIGCAFDINGELKENVISMTDYFNQMLRNSLGDIYEKALFLEITNS